LFFALWPDAQTRERIAEAAARLSWGASAQAVPPENYHVTLAFLGDVAPARLPALQRIAQEQLGVACDIAFAACDYWADSQAVVAVSVRAPLPLLQLSAGLHRDLMLSAPQRFCAHVTLARKVAQAPGRQALSPFDWRARSFCLLRSEIRGARVVYTVVDTWPLLDKR
jgi:2'-5' RNA ligase